VIRTVLLLHELRDGSSHYDWMIEQPPAPPPSTASGDSGCRPLITFRVTERIDCGQIVDFLALRIADHRSAYLTFEGEISGNRGRISRLAEGEAEILAFEDDRLVIEGRLGAARGRFSGRVQEPIPGDRLASGAPGLWEFEFEPGA
jgi:hypothetical protein